MRKLQTNVACLIIEIPGRLENKTKMLNLIDFLN